MRRELLFGILLAGLHLIHDENCFSIENIVSI